MKRRVKYTAWAGFVSGELEIFYAEDTPGYGRLYSTRKEARQFYQDVRRVIVSELPAQSVEK